MTLLAKSKDSKQNVAARTLKEHIGDCLIILNFLKEAFPKAAQVSGLGEQFWEILKVCIVCHDLGKAHGEFQKLLNGQDNEWKSQRHELFSLPFIDGLSDFEKELKSLIKLVVAGHHKDFEKLQLALNFYNSNETFGRLETIEEEQDTFEVAFNKYVQVSNGLELLKEFSIGMNVLTVKPLDGVVRSYNKSPYRQGNDNYFKLMQLFGGLKWCDHLGSAMVTELKKLEESDFHFLLQQQISLQEKGYDLYEHQKQCAQVDGNLILTAPTGSGKTESAFLWLQNQIKKHGQGRIFYILPFTASINAMYERLDNAIGTNQQKVGMLHGKLSDYLNNYFDELQYDIQTKKDNINDIKEKFKSIITPIKVTTPFQLLKHLFGLKGYEQGVFELSGAYLIFDEIHAYSPEVFAQIKVLLEFATKHLQTKVMIMTATMPRFLQTEIEKSIKPYSIIKANEALYKDFRRHKVILKDGLLSDSLNAIANQLEAGQKVLVVCNTVKSSQYVFNALKGCVGDNECILLHGSFTGADRSLKERNLLKKDIKLLVGTQAIEVSLDIDYNIIYTEPAPIDALIQRFGRVNRKRQKGICNCVVFRSHNKNDEYIYNGTIIEKTIEALENIQVQNEGIIDEAILQVSIDKVYADWNVAEKEKFDLQYKYLNEALQLLSPMCKNKYTEEDFYKQFDGIKILPQNKKEEYDRLLSEFDFISAESQKVQIRKGRFFYWKKSENIKNEISVFAKKNKMEEQRYFITNKKYTFDVGLIADEEDPWKTAEFF